MSMPPLVTTVVAWARQRRRLLGIAAALIALYGALGFWVAPGIVREQIVTQLSQALGRPVTLESVRINPFALSATLSGFAIEEANGELITAFDELYANFSSTSALMFAWRFSEIRLTRPRVALVIRPDGSFNFSALGGAAPAAPEPPETSAAAELPHVAVGEFTVTDGQVIFEDRRGQRPFRGSVDAISFSLKSFSTLPDDEGLHAFSATTDLGEQLTWRGSIGADPVQSRGRLELAAIRVPRLAAYLLPETVAVSEGAFELAVDYDVRFNPAGTNMSVSNGRLALRDVRAKADVDLTPLNLELTQIAASVTGLAERPGSRADATLEFTPNGAGKVAVNGTFGLDPLTADLKISATDVALAPFQTFVEPHARLKLERGAAHVDGSFTITAEGDQTMQFAGNAGISDLAAVDSARNQSFARWRRLDVEKIAWRSRPAALSIARISAEEPYLRFIIGPDRVTNLQHILSSPGEPAAGPPAAAAAPVPVRIGLVTVRNGSANFADQTLQPNFATGLQQLAGSITGLSSQAEARAKVALKGKVDRYAPATIEGEINPLAAQAYSDIRLRFENIELTSFTPYSGKFAGHRIDKGKLNLDLRYQLVERELKGENKIVIDQLTLGERIESPEALDLPLQLAIAILQDSRGVIDVDLPVRGNLDDPDFSYAGIVWKALANLIMKAITAPFAMLAAAFGGGEELGYVSFVPGMADISSGEQEKLDKLARALADRPQLRLEVRGTVAGDADRQGIANARLMRKIGRGDAAPATPLTAGEQRRLLSLYRDQFDEDPKLPPDVPAAEREARRVEAARLRLIETIPVTEAELRELARNRGIAIGDYLVTRANVAKERVFLTDPTMSATAAADGVRSELKLATR